MRQLLVFLSVALLLVACRSRAGLEPEIELAEDSQAPGAGETIQEPAGPIDEAQSLLEEGKTLLDEDQCAAALAKLESAVALNPELAEAFLALGNAHSRSGDSEAALNAYQKALDLDAGYAAAHTNLGAAYLRQAATMDDVDSAIAEFKTAIEIEPDDAETSRQFGLGLLAGQLIATGTGRVRPGH